MLVDLLAISTCSRLLQHPQSPSHAGNILRCCGIEKWRADSVLQSITAAARTFKSGLFWTRGGSDKFGTCIER